MITTKGTFEECPKCYSNSFYTKTKAKGYIHTWYNYDGEIQEDSSQMYNAIREYGRTECYCDECHEYLGILKSLE